MIALNLTVRLNGWRIKGGLIIKIIVAILFSTFIFASPLFARPPREIIVDYKISEKMLTVEVKHPTHDPNSDFIKKIVVTKEGGEFLTFYFANQPDKEKQVLEVRIDAKPLEKISVEAQCKKGGMKKVTFTVPAEEEIPTTQGTAELKGQK